MASSPRLNTRSSPDTIFPLQMASAFRDTFFAYILRSTFGSRVFPHPDEKALPAIWQEKLSRASPRDSARSTLNDAPDADATSVLSGATASAKRKDPEKGSDTLLVEWDGPTDPDVSCCDARICTHVTPYLRIFAPYRIHKTGRVRRRHGPCSRLAFLHSLSTLDLPSILLESPISPRNST